MLKKRLFFTLLLVTCFNFFFATSAFPLTITQNSPGVDASGNIVIDKNYPGVDEYRNVFVSKELDGNVIITNDCTVKIAAGDNLIIKGNLIMHEQSKIHFLGDGNLTVLGDVIIQNGTIHRGSLNSQIGKVTITGSYTLGTGTDVCCGAGGGIFGFESVEVEGDLIIERGQNLSKAKYLVHGNMYHRIGTVRASNRLEILGNLTVGYQDDEGWHNSGSLISESKGFHLIVHGDSLLYPEDVTRVFGGEGGLFEFKGDYLSYDLSPRQKCWSYFPGGYRKLKFSGAKKQHVVMRDSYYRGIEFANTSEEGIAFEGTLLLIGTIRHNGGKITGFAMSSADITDNASFPCSSIGRLQVSEGKEVVILDDLTLEECRIESGAKITIKGSFSAKECTISSGAELKTEGSLSTIRLDSYGDLFVGGDFNVRDGENYYNRPPIAFYSGTQTEILGNLNVENEELKMDASLEAELIVHGNLVNCTAFNFLMNKLVVYGDASGNVFTRLELAGDQKQVVKGSIYFQTIKKLVLSNTSTEGVVMESYGKIEEFVHNCVPFSIQSRGIFFRDSDSDGHKDNVDAYPEDPTRWEPEGICLAVTRDFDKDGMDDGDELKYFGNASQAPTDDYDQDGLTNIWELEHSLNPMDLNDAALDVDGDGFTNEQEFLAGTDPNNPASVPMSSAAFNPAVINLLLLN